MLMQQLTFSGLWVVWSGSGVTWPAAKLYWKSLHHQCSVFLAQRNHYIPKEEHVLKAHNVIEGQQSLSINQIVQMNVQMNKKHLKTLSRVDLLPKFHTVQRQQQRHSHSHGHTTTNGFFINASNRWYGRLLWTRFNDISEISKPLLNNCAVGIKACHPIYLANVFQS